VTWYAIIDANGNLVSVGTRVAPDAELQARGLTAITLAGDPTGQVWDATTRSFSAPVVEPNSYPVLEWVQRFTPAEFMAFKNSTDPEIAFFMYQVDRATSVTPQDLAVKQGLAYAVSIGLLTQARAGVIGAN
jgi:hypothetical protein